MTLLLVDDDQRQLRMMNRMLSFEGFEVKSCVDIDEVSGAVVENPSGFELVISDFEMPRGDGLELAERLHGIEGAPPLLLCTGCNRLPDFDPGWVRGVLHKPYLKRELIDSIQAILGLN